MRIVVNDIAASSGGALTIINELYEYLKENDKDNEWFILLNDKYFESTSNIHIITLPKIKQSKFKKIWFDFVYGSIYISKLKPDLVLSMQNIITFGLKVPQFVYVHQSIPFQKDKQFSFFSKVERIYAIYQHVIGKIIKQSIKKADTVIVQTEWMKKSILEMNPDINIHVIRPTIGNINGRYNSDSFNKSSFFYPAIDAIYKNHKIIYEACDLLFDEKIHNYKVGLTIVNSRELDISNIEFLGVLSREEVFHKYSSGTLIFPSLIETFGLPLAEAMQVGTLILASDCNYAKEVLNGYENAYFFNPHNPSELANLMKKVINGEIRVRNVYEVVEDIKKETRSNWGELLSIIYKSKRR